MLVHENEAVYLPIGATHPLAKPGKIPRELIAVRSAPIRAGTTSSGLWTATSDRPLGSPRTARQGIRAVSGAVDGSLFSWPFVGGMGSGSG